MKIFLYVFCLFGIVNNVYSQDTIRFLNKTSQAVKVQEIGIEEIKYHRLDNLEGPLYVANKKEIHFIKFSNGQVDSVTVASKVPAQSVGEPLAVYKSSTPISSNEKIFISGSRLSYNGKPVGEARLMRIISNEPNNEKKGVLLKEYRQMKTYKKKQYLFGIVGLGAGLALPYVGAMASFVFDADGLPFAIGLGAGAVVGITGGVISGIFKHKRTKQRIKVAELYNN